MACSWLREGVESWLLGYLENIFGRPVEDLRPFLEAFDNLRSNIQGKNIDELATAVNRLSNGHVKELAGELGMKLRENKLHVAAYKGGLGLPLVGWGEGKGVIAEAEAVVQAKVLKERKGHILRTGILCLLAYPERVMARLDGIAGLGITE